MSMSHYKVTEDVHKTSGRIRFSTARSNEMLRSSGSEGWHATVQRGLNVKIDQETRCAKMCKLDSDY